MGKLQGKGYLEYWRTRMAIGPNEASLNGRDADRQGEEIWRMLSLGLEDLRPRSVLDFGCGWGRMLRKLHRLWPGAEMCGIDLCQEALDDIAQDRNWFECGKPALYQAIPDDQAPVELILCCMVIQHITDEGILQETADQIYRTLKRRGHLVLFENVASPRADHVRDMTADDYMQLWPRLAWREEGRLVLGVQEHVLLIGRKP
jgi:trans-aconitate methyltransferase